MNRRGLLRGALIGAAAFVAVPRALARARRAPHVFRIAARNAGKPYPGDSRLLATVSPGVRGRQTAVVSFDLSRDAVVQMEALRPEPRGKTVVWRRQRRLRAGARTMAWTPDPKLPTDTYALRLTVRDDGARRVYGGTKPTSPGLARAPVVRVLGVEARFARRSRPLGATLRLEVRTDAAAIRVRLLHCGSEGAYTDLPDQIRGQPVGQTLELDWRSRRGRWTTVWIDTETSWRSGVYAAEVVTDDGRHGWAPIVLWPLPLGRSRQAVVISTNTWQAYNFYDADADGWGDTWYQSGNPPVGLSRPYRARGAPPRWNRYDVPFLRWLHETGRRPDFLAEDDLERLDGDALRRLYDLIVFPGHTEYVTEREYDAITRFRDLGGRLIFLSANNFFWKVRRRRDRIERVKLWRELGRPEAALLGAQYRANDDGSRQAPFRIVGARSVPWLLAGTGLTNGSLLGQAVGGYGIEIDARSRRSPKGTIVVARIPHLFGRGKTAEMTYYETANGARVFSAGALDFGASILHEPAVARMLHNLWQHMRG